MMNYFSLLFPVPVSHSLPHNPPFPFSLEKGRSSRVTNLPWHLSSQYPLPVRPDKAASLGERDPKATTESETAL